MLLDRAVQLERELSTEGLWSIALEAFADIGFEFAIYVVTNPARSNVRVRTNIPELYDDFDPAMDPFLDYCCNSYEATRTGIAYLPDYDYLPDAAKAFITTARGIGFQSGFGIPTRVTGSAEYGGFNLGTRLSADKFEEQFAPQLADIRTFCLLLQRKFDELGGLNDQAVELLSPREREIIRLICNGATRKECAQLLNLSPNTVADYSKSAYRKLGVRNRAEAANRLFASGEN